MASGILIVDKPEDWTSQDVVAKLRGALHERRAGHGGTLDPMATGVLPVFFGRATRAVEFFEHAEKTYETVLRLGLVTDTQDITGRVLEQRDAASVTEADVRAVLPRFLGPQKQVPPMYSAIKIGGKKLYELARAGQEVARPARTSRSTRWSCFRARRRTSRCACTAPRGPMSARCATTSARRSERAAAWLRCGAPQPGPIRRHRPCRWRTFWPTLRRSPCCCRSTRCLRPIRATLTPAQEKCCRNGASFTLRFTPGRYRLYAESGEFLALGEVRDGRMETVKSFFAI